MGIIRDLAQQSKDKGVSKMLMVFGGELLGKYGKIMDIRLDSIERRIEIEVLLKGETAPVDIRLEDYRIVTEGQRHFIACGDIHISREWMRILAQGLIRDRTFEIPSKYARLLDAII